MELLLAGVLFCSGLALGWGLDRRRGRLLGLDPEQGRRLAELRARVDQDSKGEEEEPRLELVEYHLEQRDARSAGEALGKVVQKRGEVPEVRRAARQVLRGLLLHELRDERVRPSGLLPQDVNWHPGAKRLVLRLKDLTLGGLLELKHLDIHIDDFEPLMRTQPLPRVVACRSVVREERLAFVLDTRIDWAETPMEDFRVLFRDGQVQILGTFRLGVPIGFRLSAVAQVTGTSRIRLSFPHPPRVAGLVPLPIDTVLKLIASKVEEKLPGLVRSEHEATLEIDVLAAGIPPVEPNLREISIEDGRFEILCAADEISPELLEVLRLPAPSELLGDRDAPLPEEDPEEIEEPDADPARAGAAGLLGSLAGFFRGGPRGPVARARAEAEALAEQDDDRGALRILEDAWEKLGRSYEDPALAPLLEDLGELRLEVGGAHMVTRGRELLERLVEHHPRRPRASLLLGRAHGLEGERERAEERTRIACTLAPFGAEGYRQLAGFLEERGARRAADRSREARKLLEARRLPVEAEGEPPEPRGVLFHEGFRELLHATERGPTGELVANLQGSLGWLDPSPPRTRGEDGVRALTSESHPRFLRLLEGLARGLQVPPPQVLQVPSREPGEFRVRGGWQPWIEVPAGSLEGLDERGLAFQIGRCLQLLRAGRGSFLGLEEDQLDLLFALLRAVGEEAHRQDTRPAGLADRTLARMIGDTVDTLAQGWVVRSEDLDPWVPRDIRQGARRQALAFHDAHPGYLDLVAWQWSLEASADRAGLLLSGSLTASLLGIGRAPSEYWPEARDEGLELLAERVREDRVAYRVQELLRFAVSAELEELERLLFS